MSDFDPVPHYPDSPPVEAAPAEVMDAAPSSTEPPAAEIVAETPAVEVAVEKEPPLRTTPEGVILSKVTVSAEGVVLKVED